MASQSMTNAQKVAALLLTMGVERAAEVLAYLDAAQVDRIAREIALMGNVPHQTRRAVLREFRARVSADAQRRAGLTFAEEVVGKAMGEQHAQALVQKITPSVQVNGPAFLSTVTTGRAAELLTGEPPHIIALLLVSLPTDCAAATLSALPADLQPRVAEQLAKTATPTSEVRAQLEKAVRAKAGRDGRTRRVDGRLALAEMQRCADVTPVAAHVERRAMPPVVREEPRPAASASPVPAAQTLAFDDLGRVDRLVLQEALRSVETQDLCIALRAADSALAELLLGALPFGRRIAVQNRMKLRQPVRLSAITDAQARIARAVSQVARGERTPVREATHV